MHLKMFSFYEFETCIIEKLSFQMFFLIVKLTWNIQGHNMQDGDLRMIKINVPQI